MSDRHELVSDLFDAALKRSPEDRIAFLREACGGDHALLQELEALLLYEPTAAGFLETPAPEMLGDGRVEPARMLGRQLGPYKVVAPLGAGGMGEVYRAHDNKLDRDVAIKILSRHLPADPERRARFAREARLLATLNHPHIGAIYGLEESDGVTALVLELVEGPTLAERLEQGPLPIPTALAIARQIIEALTAAHKKGIVHRDLKPANIVLQAGTELSSGDVRAKVLDFGVAKAITPGPENDLKHHRADSRDDTLDGLVLGTPAYMSPEQARGLPVDKRTDVWAFGCVLFEMLTGSRAFGGEKIADTIADVLDHQPDWSLLPHATPKPIRTLLRRCLEKVPGRRLRDISDARIELDEEESLRLLQVAEASLRSRAQIRRAAIAATVFGLLAAGGWFAMRFYPLAPAADIGNERQLASLTGGAQITEPTIERRQSQGTSSPPTTAVPEVTPSPRERPPAGEQIGPASGAASAAATPPPDAASGQTAGTGLELAARPAQTTVPPAEPALSDADAKIEKFLKTARVLRTTVTGKALPMRATLTDDTVTHDARVIVGKIKGNVPQDPKMNFLDSGMSNVAGYRLDRLIGMNLVPVTVERSWQETGTTFAWWVDDVLTAEQQRAIQNVEPGRTAEWNEQMEMVRLFDQLIDKDRDLGTVMITKDWNIWVIDHTGAFSLNKTLKAPEKTTRCDSQVFERMKQLDNATLTREMGRYLTSFQIDALLARRDLIVARIEHAGAGALFDRQDARGIRAILRAPAVIDK